MKLKPGAIDCMTFSKGAFLWKRLRTTEVQILSNDFCSVIFIMRTSSIPSSEIAVQVFQQQSTVKL